MKTVFALILVSSLVMLQTACQSTSIVSDDFNDAVDEGDFKTADRTSIIFLVDGLSKTALDQAYQSGKISRISGYFPMPKGNFRLARATFPSLTFPNITSILTGESISTHPITGNKIVVGDDEVDFENVTSWPVLGRLVKERSIFYRLGENKESSVSFSYSFPRGATVHLEKNVDAGVYYTEGNYAAIDSNVIANLEGLLEQKSWPRFIFVHLIGVDALSHKHGPEDPSVVEYISTLDRQLARSFELLRAQKSRVQAVLTSDHGFKKTKFEVPLKRVLSQMKSEVRAVYDNRVAYLYTSNLDMPSRLTLARELGTLERVSMTALKRENGIDLFTAAKRQARIDYAVAPCPSGLAARFRWIDEKVENSFHCIEDYDKVSSVKNDSFVVSALVEFFVSRHAPDIVVLPDGNSDFTGIYGGNHGGLTPEEILVPFLSREVEMPPGIFPSHKTLEIMGLKNTKN